MDDEYIGKHAKKDNMIHTKCLRCGEHAVSIPFGMTGLPYTNYSYCEKCLREGLKLLKGLVRCKDCKEWVGGGIDDKDNFIPPMCKRYNTPKHADGFCDEGKKKLQEEM